jgi:hypothetical protein
MHGNTLRWSRLYLFEGPPEVVAAVTFLFFAAPPEVVAALFFFFSLAFSTASLEGNCMTDDVGLASTKLVSVLVLVAFFCLFFGTPLHKTKHNVTEDK